MIRLPRTPPTGSSWLTKPALASFELAPLPEDDVKVMQRIGILSVVGSIPFVRVRLFNWTQSGVLGSFFVFVDPPTQSSNMQPRVSMKVFHYTGIPRIGVDIAALGDFAFNVWVDQTFFKQLRKNAMALEFTPTGWSQVS